LTISWHFLSLPEHVALSDDLLLEIKGYKTTKSQAASLQEQPINGVLVFHRS
jgi:hypothetical protein